MKPLPALIAALLLMPTFASELSQPDAKNFPDLFLWTDTCNVWVLRDGDAALLIDLGDGAVLEHLSEIGVRRVEWLLLTDHHRELFQGSARLDRNVTRIAAPKLEQALFETPTLFRKWRPRLNDFLTVHGSSFVRPPNAPLKVDRWLATDDVVSWHSHEIRCLSTPGHSPGGMSYVLRRGDSAYAFTGGIVHDGAKFTNWFDTEWDYGFAKGLDALFASVDTLIALHPHYVCPSQGPVLRKATEQLTAYREKLTAFRADYIRGYPVENLTKRGMNLAVKQTAVSMVVQVTPHLYMFGKEMAGKNFAVIISDNGKGLLLDCGLFSKQILETLIADMKLHLGLKQIDACWISHMHGDHFTLAPTLKEHGVKLWTLESIVDKCEHPLRYDYPALIPSYGLGFESATIDRALHNGETLEWEGYPLHIDWMPGQTEFGNCLWLELDGKRIAFTGDNLFGNPDDAAQNGHECVVARNSAILEDGYQLGSTYLQKLKPDIIMGAHSVLMTQPAAFVDRYAAWAKRMSRLYQDLLPDPDYAYLYDPYWVSAYPYRVDLRTNESQTIQVTVRNFRNVPQKHRVALKLPPGFEADPAVLEGIVAAKSRQSYPVKINVVNRATLQSGVQIVTFDITLDGKRYGELFDFIVLGRDKPAKPTP